MIDESQVYDYGLIVPEGTDVNTLAPEIQAIVSEYKAEFPSARVYGTVSVNNRQIVYVRMQRMLTEGDLNNLFAAYNLDWEVIGIRSAYKIVEIDMGEDQFGNQIITQGYHEILPVDKVAVIPFVPNATLTTPLSVPVYAGTDPIRL